MPIKLSRASKITYEYGVNKKKSKLDVFQLPHMRPEAPEMTDSRSRPILNLMYFVFTAVIINHKRVHQKYSNTIFPTQSLMWHVSWGFCWDQEYKRYNFEHTGMHSQHTYLNDTRLLSTLMSETGNTAFILLHTVVLYYP